MKWPAALPTAMGLQTRWLSVSPNLRGAFWMVLAGAGFTVNNVLVKELYAQGVDPFQAAFARAVFALVALMPLLLRQGTGILRTRHPGIHLLRGLFGGGAMLCGFYAVTQLPLAEVCASRQIADISYWTHGLHLLHLGRPQMPWKECKPMDERLRFIARRLEGEKMSALCRGHCHINVLHLKDICDIISG